MVGLTVVACGVSNTDPSLWTQSKDIGGTSYSPVPGAAGEAQGAAGESTMSPTQGEGGVQQGTGNAPPAGNGGVPMQGSGGTTGFPPPGMGGAPQATGGIVQSVGGTTTIGAGGMQIGSGGTTTTGSGGTTTSAGGVTVTGGNSGKCTFKFDVTTVTAHGTYAPANVGAIWITDSSNKFVKTLMVWGTIRLSNATSWTSSSGSNRTDAVSSATRRSHGPLSATWDCTNTSEAAVPDGMYTVNVTFAESDSLPFFGGSSPKASVNFTKSAAGDTEKGTDTANFTGMQVSLTIP